MNRAFQRMALPAAIAMAIGSSSIAFPKPAQASWGDAINLLRDSWGSIVQYSWSPWNKQVFMTNLSWQETRDVRNQYRSRADGVLHDRCVNKVANTYLSGWQNTAFKTSHRWVVAMRVENNQANCFARMPNKVADEFIRRRGW